MDIMRTTTATSSHNGGDPLSGTAAATAATATATLNGLKTLYNSTYAALPPAVQFTAAAAAASPAPNAHNSSNFAATATGMLDVNNGFSATTLPAMRSHLELGSTSAAAAAAAAAATFPTAGSTAQTVATFIAAGNKNRATTVIIYPTVSPESIVIPIVSCIFGFPILALIVICCLRRRAKMARERDRRRNYDMQDHAVSLVRFSPIHRLNYRSSRAISLRPERSLSQGFTSLELDTVLEEERCSDVEQTQTEILNAESPLDSTSYKMSFSSS